jgi:hypothetical protein
MSTEPVVGRSSDYYLSIDRRRNENSGWEFYMRLPEDYSIEYARIQMEQVREAIQEALPTTQFRLVETRTETVKRDVS